MARTSKETSRSTTDPAPVVQVVIHQTKEALTLPVVGYTRLYDGRRDRIDFGNKQANEFSAGWLVKVERFASGEARGWYKTAYSGVGSRGLWPIAVTVSGALLDALPVQPTTVTLKQLAQEVLAVLDVDARRDLTQPGEAWTGLENGAGIEIGSRIDALIRLAREVLSCSHQ